MTDWRGTLRFPGVGFVALALLFLGDAALTGKLDEIDQFVEEAAQIGEISAVARSGSVAVSKGEVTLSSYATHHRLSG